MFNPYAVRPIGSQQFLEHLKDVQARVYWETVMPEELQKGTDGIELAGSLPWGSERVKNDPYSNLYTAIIALTVMDYLDNYLKRNNKLREGDDAGYWVFESRCIDLENHFFRRDPYREIVFERMLHDICWMGDDEIEKCMARMKRVLRWTKHA